MTDTQTPEAARPIDLRARLKAGKACVGAWQTVPSAKVTEAMASRGFHWLAVDLEHSAMSLETVEACFIAAERYGVAPMARLPNADPYMARRLLDTGAAGLIVPSVEDPDAFAAFAAHCVYGEKRGVGLSRCNAYGDTFEPYFNDFQPVLVAQIETRKGTEAADALAAMATVDALFLGPYDLSVDLGTPGDFTSTAFTQAAQQVREACAKHGKVIGIHQIESDDEALAAKAAEGYGFIAYATDILAMRHALGYPARTVDPE